MTDTRDLKWPIFFKQNNMVLSSKTTNIMLPSWDLFVGFGPFYLKIIDQIFKILNKILCTADTRSIKYYKQNFTSAWILMQSKG